MNPTAQAQLDAIAHTVCSAISTLHAAGNPAYSAKITFVRDTAAIGRLAGAQGYAVFNLVSPNEDLNRFFAPNTFYAFEKNHASDVLKGVLLQRKTLLSLLDGPEEFSSDDAEGTANAEEFQEPLAASGPKCVACGSNRLSEIRPGTVQCQDCANMVTQ